MSRAPKQSGEAASRYLVLSVVKVREGSELSVGAVFEVNRHRVRIGRGPDMDVRLNDRTVSREHVVLIDEGDRLVLENVSSGGTTFVERAPVPVGERVVLDPHESNVQLGGVLLRLRTTAETTAFQSALTIDGVTLSQAPIPARADAPLLGLTWDAGRCHVRLNGRLLTLYPAAASLLAALGASPGEPVHRFELEDALGDAGSVEQQVSMLRRAFAEQIEAGVVSLDALRDHVRKHSAGAHIATLDTMDARAVLRHFIAARRGYGYMLCLGPDDVHLDAGDA